MKGKRKKSVRNLVTMLVIMSMLMGMINHIELAAATTETKSVFQGDGYEVTFSLNNQWENEFQGELEIKNTGQETMENWYLMFEWNGEISSIWNGDIVNHQDGIYILKNAGWNQDIQAGETVVVGFSGVTEGEIVLPTAYGIPTQRVTADSSDYQITLEYSSVWESGYQASLTITNLTEKTLADWSVSFEFGNEITSAINGVIQEQTGHNYVIQHSTYEKNIEPGSSVTVILSGGQADTRFYPEEFELSYVDFAGNQEEENSVTDENLDTDSDGLLDWQEEYYNSSIDSADTDQDGLSDFDEVTIFHSDPASCDTDENGLMDGEEDLDGDGVTNLEEQTRNTAPEKADTDGDGISDGDEILLYHTAPVLSDTDKDGLEDGEELALGLNPLEQCSDGITLDGKRLISQSLSKENIEEGLLTEEGILVPELSGSVAGNINKHISILSKDTVLDAFAESGALIGEPVEVVSSYLEPVELNLTFHFAQMTASYEEERINNLSICRLENSSLIPLSTEISIENQTLSTKIKKEGIYFVMEVNTGLNSVGIHVEENLDGAAVSLLSEEKFVQGNNQAAAMAVSGETWVLLSDYQYVKLNGPVASTSTVDTDGDGVTDYKELGTLKAVTMTALINTFLVANGIPSEYYSGKTTIYVYNYVSNPTLTDTDFDGRNDNIDTAPRSGVFTGKLKDSGADISADISYTLDYRTFFGSSSDYNSALSVTSSVYAAGAYNNITILNSANATTYSLNALMAYQGFSDVKVYKLSSAYTDYHLSEVTIGHRKVTYNGVTKEVVAVVVRGTNSTLAEWASNFDVGDTSTYTTSSDWAVKANHKGFDIAATRILKYLTTYLAAYVNSSVTKAIWVTGHSRGAAISNILGARLVDKGYTTFAYTYAAPNTTTAATAKNYKSIFNIMNSDDFVPYLPMTAWGFTRYGRTATVSLADNYESEWEKLTGIWDYNPDTYGMQDTINSLAKIAKDRVDCYKYTCSCHGDGSKNNITITNYGMSKSSREGAIAKIPVNALAYCKITRYTGFLCVGWNFDCCQTPSYFMQVLAAQMAGTISTYRFVVELDVADRYEDAKSNIIASAIGGLEHPHYAESYYVLANHVKASNF
ncbi:cellulose binding domain-containing protein [Anaeromicropila populeti]|uniref:Cellulose binding domain-containing protein n=1 Tax=Anaeromicropila populeti TaxID=37658 RepID=A0A1I6IYE2_9FIRM|nr:cellulose binding domain-containing protein [Anaeromicropila populeti]SFR71765.1 Cellulose binding domain-containing protein [Anaeromicropila populeti]